jgi:hypothetical protein
MQPLTRALAAIHEAGHFIAFERLGMVAGEAYIVGSPFGRNGWSGGAIAWRAAAIARSRADYAPSSSSPNELRVEAISSFAGPVAEELLGGGDARHNISELIGACVCAERAAQLSREGREAVARALTRTISLVEQYEHVIRGIATVLDRKKSIWRHDQPVRKILAGVPQGPFDAAPLSAKGQALCNKIVGALAELPSLGLPTFGRVAWFGEVM